MWNHFIFFAVSALILWVAGAALAWRGKCKPAILLTVGGIGVFFAYILAMWISLEHPPLRTMGETRLWYSLFLPVAGLFVYGRWRYKWILTFSTIMATVFIMVNLLKPEIHTKTLMPALQSPWFAPHVIVYMFAYAMLGAAFLMAVWMIFSGKGKEESGKGKEESGKWKEESGKGKEESGKWKEESGKEKEALASVDNMVYVGLSFMTFGMLFGALWAKEAWGHYWSWDPKETWAAATWLGYLSYIHYRLYPRHRPRVALWLLVVCFLLLQMCWWGINYLPAAQGASVHTYG